MDIGTLTPKEVRELFNNKKRFVEMWAKHHKIIKSYRYLITFTIDPKKYENQEIPYDGIEEYIIKQFTSRKALKISKAYISKEGDGVEKHIHWHVNVESTKSLTKDRFNYYIKKYGNIDFSPTKSQNLESGINYISKDTLPRQIV